MFRNKFRLISLALCFLVVSFHSRAALSYSSSNYSELNDGRVPSRPRAPTISLSAIGVTLKIIQPPTAQGVTIIESQYRKVDIPSSWTTGPIFDTNTNFQRNSLVLNINNLTVGLYETRIRMLNQYGYSPYSSSSEQFNIVNRDTVIATPITESSVDLLPSTLSIPMNSFTGSNSSFSKISSTYPQEVESNKFLGPSLTAPASGAVAARELDFYYVTGVGTGGTEG
jgi:hypothetical protein